VLYRDHQSRNSRKQLREAGFDQPPQITDASHLIVFAATKDIDDALIDQYIQRVAHTRGISLENLRSRSTMIKEYASKNAGSGRSDRSTLLLAYCLLQQLLKA
jgi:hypothetical protein